MCLAFLDEVLSFLTNSLEDGEPDLVYRLEYRSRDDKIVLHGPIDGVPAFAPRGGKKHAM